MPPELPNFQSAQGETLKRPAAKRAISDAAEAARKEVKEGKHPAQQKQQNRLLAARDQKNTFGAIAREQFSPPRPRPARRRTSSRGWQM